MFVDRGAEGEERGRRQEVLEGTGGGMWDRSMRCRPPGLPPTLACSCSQWVSSRSSGRPSGAFIEVRSHIRHCAGAAAQAR